MAFRSGAGAVGGANDSITLNKPAGTASGDILVICIEDYIQAVTWPTGFSATLGTCTTDGVSDGRSSRFSCAWKLAGGAEPGTYTVTIGGGNNNDVKGVIGAWSGRVSTGPGTPVATNNAAETASPVTGALTGYTAAAGDDIVVFVCMTASNTAGSWATTTSSGCTVQLDENDIGAFFAGILNLSNKDNLAAGATGTLSFTETRTGGAGGGDLSGIVVPLPAAPVGPAPILMGGICL